MDQQALIEQQVLLFRDCVTACKKIWGTDPTVDQVMVIYEQVNDWLISAKISAERQQARDEKEAKPKSDVKCRDCGNQLTVGEKEFCDKNDKPYRCYKCSKK
jgi:predicted RNA-binding Zn-ribbon protein involved in translation (DUF1610 family)